MIEVSAREKSTLAKRLREYCEEELECDMGNLQAELFVDFLTREFAPVFYNSGLRDAQALLLKRLDELGDTIAALEVPA